MGIHNLTIDETILLIDRYTSFTHVHTDTQQRSYIMNQNIENIRADKQEIPSLYPTLDLGQISQPYSYDQANTEQQSASTTVGPTDYYATAQRTVNPDEDVDFDGKPYSVGEGEISTEDPKTEVTEPETVEKSGGLGAKLNTFATKLNDNMAKLDVKANKLLTPAAASSSNTLSPDTLTAPGTMSRGELLAQKTKLGHGQAHSRPIIEEPKTTDDYAGYTADPVLKQICYGTKFALRNHKEKGVTKFEVRVNDAPYMLLQGSEKDQMLNGFSLKVLSLGIVKTRFSFALSDNHGTQVIEASRGIGASTFIDLNFHYFGEKLKCGYIQPTGFNLNRISYHIYDENKRHLFTFQSGMLRGLLSSGYDLVLPNKKEKFATFARNGDLVYSGRGLDHSVIPMKQKLLILATCQIMQMHI